MIHVYVAGACGEVADEREAVLAGVLASGHWPGGPGVIGVADGAPLPAAILQPWIRRADAMVLVLAASDGGPGPDGQRSLTEWELDEAGALGLPVITVALADRMVAASKRRLLGPGLRERFALLRQAAIDDGAPVLDSVDALRAAIVVGLARVVHGGEVPRWIREDEVMVRGRVVDELARLSAENAALRRLAPVAADAAPPVAAREVAGLTIERWQGLLGSRSVRDLRTRQPLTLGRALLDHAAAFALGVLPGDKPSPLEHWLYHEVGGPLCSLGLVDLGEAGVLRLADAARPLIAALGLLELGGRGEETVVATSDSALRARIAAEPAPRPRVDDEKTNFWTVDGPAPPRKPR